MKELLGEMALLIPQRCKLNTFSENSVGQNVESVRCRERKRRKDLFPNNLSSKNLPWTSIYQHQPLKMQVNIGLYQRTNTVH